MNNNSELHEVISKAIKETERLRELVTPFAYAEGGARGLEIRKAMYDVEYYLKALELNTREVTDEESETDEYEAECDMYGM